MFEHAKWIWCQNADVTDSYTEFYVNCELDEDIPVQIRISADSNYAVYVNGAFADSGQYADFPHYKVFDEIDISHYIHAGKNHIAIVVWHYGISSFGYYIGKPGVIFEVAQAGEIICSSDENILCRKSRRYISGRNVKITEQLGLTFHVDMKENDNWMIGLDLDDFGRSFLQTEMPQKLYPREIRKLVVKPRVASEIVSQGGFTYLPEEGHAGFRMMHAAISFYRWFDIGEKKEEKTILNRPCGEGIYFIVDLKEETAGYVDFDIEVDEDCELEIGWGEHLEDGRCSTQIAERNFSATVSLKRGRNSYMNPFRRMGCRYLQFFVHTSKVAIYYAGLKPSVYPVTIQPYESDNLLRNEIYKVCCNTLLHCMHEHYEDCPWREQAFYSLDSRNQMLCGYYAFGETEFPKAGLKLIARSIREDGLLPMCYPTNDKLAIPSFALSYLLQLAEYYRYTGDKETVTFCFDTAKTVIDTFVGRIDETGLVPIFDETKKYWNFYEWQPYLNGRGNEGKVYDMCLNAWLSLALDYFIEICEALEIDAKDYRFAKTSLNESIAREFYDEAVGLFVICRGQDRDQYSVLANALGCLCGAAEHLNRDTMMKIILQNGWDGEGMDVIPATLSMHTFRYEALLKENRDVYKDKILDEIDHVYFRMLRMGATSFWETELGSRDFSYAGSLCHGWSAMPIYYYKTLGERQDYECEQ